MDEKGQRGGGRERLVDWWNDGEGPVCNAKLLCNGKVQKNKEKKLTSVSFAFTHTHTPVKTNIFPFFPQANMENFEKCAKTQKLKQKIYCPMLPVVVSFPPSFLNLSLMWFSMFKTSTLKENCLLNYCWGKKEEKN